MQLGLGWQHPKKGGGRGGGSNVDSDSWRAELNVPLFSLEGLLVFNFYMPKVESNTLYC